MIVITPISNELGFLIFASWSRKLPPDLQSGGHRIAVVIGEMSPFGSTVNLSRPRHPKRFHDTYFNLRQVMGMSLSSKGLFATTL